MLLSTLKRVVSVSEDLGLHSCSTLTAQKRCLTDGTFLCVIRCVLKSAVSVNNMEDVA